MVAVASVVAAVVFMAPVFAEGDPIGVVDRTSGDAYAQSDGTVRPLTAGDSVFLGDRLTTGEGARVTVYFVDDTRLTLGAHSDFTIDRFAFESTSAFSRIVFKFKRGAFRVASKLTELVRRRTLSVTGPAATIGIRGTVFWGGDLADGFNVLVLEGSVAVANGAGEVILAEPGQGTTVASADTAPSAPKEWGQAKRDLAAATIAY